MNLNECLRRPEAYDYIVAKMVKRNNVVTYIIAEPKSEK
jgi:hypothetical protein